MEIRALRASDDRSYFRSGDSDLDRFFEKYAAQNQFRHHIGTTYVAVEDRILGYVTVAAGHIEIEALPAAARKRLPRYPLPILRLARLAVDQSAQGRGRGHELLRFVLRLAVQMSDELGCLGVVVDAKPGAVDFYRSFGFVVLDVREGQSPGRPQTTAMFLGLSDIETARHRRR